MPRVATLRKGRPLGFAPDGSRSIAAGVEMVESSDGSGAVFLWGMAAWTWSANDVAGRRLAAVQLVATNSATAREVAAGFSVAEPTLWRWRDGYARDGVAGLLPKKKGPKRPSKLSEDKVTEITQLRRNGLSLRAIATRAGRIERAPTRGSEAPSVMTGAASSSIPALAAWRSSTRSMGGARGWRPCAWSLPASVLDKLGPSARWTESWLTPTLVAMARSDRPSLLSWVISVTLSSLSLEGRLGPFFFGRSPATPSRA